MLVSVSHLLLLDGSETPLRTGNEFVQSSHVFCHRLLLLRVFESLLSECTEANLVLSVVEGRVCLRGWVVDGALRFVDIRQRVANVAGFRAGRSALSWRLFPLGRWLLI